MTKQKEDNRHESQSKAVKFLHGHKGVNLRPWPNNPENELTLVKAAKASCPKVKSRGKTTAKRKKRKERRKHSLEIVGNRRGLSITFDGQLRTRDGMGWDVETSGSDRTYTCLGCIESRHNVADYRKIVHEYLESGKVVEKGPAVLRTVFERRTRRVRPKPKYRRNATGFAMTRDRFTFRFSVQPAFEIPPEGADCKFTIITTIESRNDRCVCHPTVLPPVIRRGRATRRGRTGEKIRLDNERFHRSAPLIFLLFEITAPGANCHPIDGNRSFFTPGSICFRELIDTVICLSLSFSCIFTIITMKVIKRNSFVSRRRKNGSEIRPSSDSFEFFFDE